MNVRDLEQDFIINEETIFYTVNIPASKDEFTNKFYFIFNKTPTKHELLRQIRGSIDRISNTYIRSERFKGRIPKIKENLEKVSLNNIDLFLEDYKTYRLDINEDLFMTINRINPRLVVLEEEYESN